jgi:transcription antitermination factor NusA-like protein
MNYIGDVGGVNKFILSHMKMLEGENISHVHIFPRRIRNPVTNRFLCKCWGITIDGIENRNLYDYENMKQIINQLLGNNAALIDIHIHHTLGSEIDQLEYILSDFDSPMKYYLHDYYSVCTQFNLLKNGKVFCGPEAISDVKCHECDFYSEAKGNYKAHYSFLKKFKEQLLIIAPSKIAGDIWLYSYPDFKDQLIVLKHQKLMGMYTENCNYISEEEPLKVAFVGVQEINKGWLEWKEAIEKASLKGCHMKFYHFGRTNDKIPYITKIPVKFSGNNINAMVNALRNEKIDITVLWSIWPETYSYTCYECCAANTFIITNKDSGNIASVVKENNNGVVLSNDVELISLLSDEDQLRKKVNDFKKSKNFGPLLLEENKDILNFLQKKQSILINDTKNLTNVKISFLLRVYKPVYYLYNFIKSRFS